MLEDNCAKIQDPSQANRSDSQPPSHNLFEHSLFSLPISKVKLVRGYSMPNTGYSIQKRCESATDSLISVSSKEVDHGEKIGENEKLLQKEPFETDLNALFQLDKDLKGELSSIEKSSACPRTVQFFGIPNHLKSTVAACSLILDQTFQLVTGF